MLDIRLMATGISHRLWTFYSFMMFHVHAVMRCSTFNYRSGQECGSWSCSGIAESRTWVCAAAQGHDGPQPGTLWSVVSKLQTNFVGLFRHRHMKLNILTCLNFMCLIKNSAPRDVNWRLPVREIRSAHWLWDHCWRMAACNMKMRHWSVLPSMDVFV